MSESYAAIFSVFLQVFVNARLHVSGGALGGGRMVEDASSVAGVLLGLSFCNHVNIHVSCLYLTFRLDQLHVAIFCSV